MFHVKTTPNFSPFYLQMSHYSQKSNNTSKIEQQIEQMTSAWRLSATPFLSELSISASNPIFIQIFNLKK